MLCQTIELPIILGGEPDGDIGHLWLSWASGVTATVMMPTHLAGLPWAGSLGWLEHPADNREVASSNLASPTPFSSLGPPVDFSVVFG